MAMELRPPSLDDIGLSATINWLCREFQSIYPRIRVDLEFEASEQLIPSPLKTVIFRIIKETLSSIGQHSFADKILIHLEIAGSQIRLEIEDNGLAFHPAGDSVDRERESTLEISMASTRERTLLSGGEFSMDSNRLGGTRYQAVWSLG